MRWEGTTTPSPPPATTTTNNTTNTNANNTITTANRGPRCRSTLTAATAQASYAPV